MYKVTLFRRTRKEFLPIANSVTVFKPEDESWDSLIDGIEVQDRDNVHTIIELEYEDGGIELLYLWELDAFTREDYTIV